MAFKGNFSLPDKRFLAALSALSMFEKCDQNYWNNLFIPGQNPNLILTDHLF